MNAAILLATAIVVGVFVELVLPGRDVYHYGWYNALLIALVVVLAFRVRGILRSTQTPRARWGILLAALGVGVIGFAGVANGLLAPDNRTIVGAPGQQVRLEEVGGSLAFPLAQDPSSAPDQVHLVRPGRAPLAVSGTRDIGAFMLQPLPRSVIYVQAADARGNHLTVTQPTGAAFLSPVLLMQDRQTIAGMSLPYDSFAVPAARRIVKAVLFTPQQASQLHGFSGAPGNAVLFAADDDSDQPLPHGIALAKDGETIALSGLVLRPLVLSYPAVEVIAVPSMIALIAGLLAILAGGALTAQRVPG